MHSHYPLVRRLTQLAARSARPHHHQNRRSLTKMRPRLILSRHHLHLQLPQRPTHPQPATPGASQTFIHSLPCLCLAHRFARPGRISRRQAQVAACWRHQASTWASLDERPLTSAAMGHTLTWPASRHARDAQPTTGLRPVSRRATCAYPAMSGMAMRAKLATPMG